jgi:hypothetical protein
MCRGPVPPPKLRLNKSARSLPWHVKFLPNPNARSAQWSGREIADELKKRNIVAQISPRHASRLLKKTIWCANFLKRGSCSSLDELKTKVLDFIEYYNRTMAKPFKWTYQGKPLMA